MKDFLKELLSGLFTDQKLGALGAKPSDPSFNLHKEIAATGYKTPQPPNIPESRDLAHCHPELVTRYQRLKAAFRERTGRDLFETCTWRSSEKQQELYKVGRRGIPGEKIITKIDGVTKRSRHNFFPSQALDVCVDTDPGPGKHPVWDESSYLILGPLCGEFGLVWGGNFSFKDYPHVEIGGSEV